MYSLNISGISLDLGFRVVRKKKKKKNILLSGLLSSNRKRKHIHNTQTADAVLTERRTKWERSCCKIAPVAIDERQNKRKKHNENRVSTQHITATKHGSTNTDRHNY